MGCDGYRQVLNGRWGFARNIVVMPNGTRVVPVEEAGGRIQVYDPAWKFISGWYPDPKGGQFTVRPAESNNIEVIARQHSMRYLYDLNGLLVSQSSYAPTNYIDFSFSGEPSKIPTPWWLWIFSTSFHALIIMAVGAFLVFLGQAIITGHGPTPEKG